MSIGRSGPNTRVQLGDGWADDGWFRFPRAFARDARLSWKARGIAALLASHTSTFVFSASELQKWSKDGRDATAAGLRELEDMGYLTRERQSSGEMLYTLFPEPQTENPEEAEGVDDTGFQGEGNPAADHPGVYKETTPKETTSGEEEPLEQISLTSGEEQRSGSAPWSVGGVPVDATAEGMAAALQDAADEIGDALQGATTKCDLQAIRDAEKPTEDDIGKAFDTWYPVYPRKVGKDAARKAFAKVMKRAKTVSDARALWQQLVDGARRYAAEKAGSDKQYIAHPQTWLNQGRWQDEVTTPAGGARPAWHADDDKWATYDPEKDGAAAGGGPQTEDPGPEAFGVRL